MGIRVAWFNEQKTILLEVFEGSWTLEDYHRLIDEAALMLASVDHTVHILVDGRLAAMPPGKMISGMQYAARRVPPNQGITVFVGVDFFSKMLINTASRVFPRLGKTLFSVNKFEEAEQIIARHIQAADRTG